MAIPRAGTITFEVRGPIARSDLPGLCDRICEVLAQTSATLAFCDVASVDPDAVTIDALAARRRGCQIRLLHASPALLELLAFLGLGEVLPA